MCEGCSYTYPPLSIARYSFIQLSELEQCRVKKTCPIFFIDNYFEKSNGFKTNIDQVRKVKFIIINVLTDTIIVFHRTNGVQELRAVRPSCHRPPHTAAVCWRLWTSHCLLPLQPQWHREGHCSSLFPRRSPSCYDASSWALCVAMAMAMDARCLATHHAVVVTVDDHVYECLRVVSRTRKLRWCIQGDGCCIILTGFIKEKSEKV